MDTAQIKFLSQKATLKRGMPVNERIGTFSLEQKDYLSYLAVLNEYLSKEDIIAFLEICGFSLDDEIYTEFIEIGLSEYIVVPEMFEDEPISFFTVENKTKKYIWQSLTEEEKMQRHEFADGFYRKIFFTVFRAVHENEETLLQDVYTDDDLTNLVISPGGFIDFGAHYPQAADFHNWSILRAYYWQEHLFSLGKFDEASNITNSICFALARKGHKRIAKEMLTRNVVMMSGINKTVALVNLATLLREDQEHKAALHIYRRTLFPLIKRRAFPQIAAVFSEMSNIHRDYGHLARAIMFQHASSLMRSVINDYKGKAICNNQLSILYRSLRLRKIALRYSRSAEAYWRVTDDEVNLAKTLLTQGNILNHMRQPTKALVCFDESLEINNRIESYSEAASSLSGKARAYMMLQNFTGAKIYLDEAISLRQRFDIRRIGIEYENMGGLYEGQGNLSLAVGWYKKALPYFEQYQPVHAPNCKRKIRSLESRL